MSIFFALFSICEKYYTLSTLIYYGDVQSNNIYDFTDSDSISYDNAFGKRITRLSENLPNTLEKMNGGFSLWYGSI